MSDCHIRQLSAREPSPNNHHVSIPSCLNLLLCARIRKRLDRKRMTSALYPRHRLRRHTRRQTWRSTGTNSKNDGTRVVKSVVGYELEQLSARVGVESAGVVDVEDGFFADEVGGQAVAPNYAGAEIGEEGGRGREIVFAVALVDFGGSLWAMDMIYQYSGVDQS